MGWLVGLFVLNLLARKDNFGSLLILLEMLYTVGYAKRLNLVKALLQGQFGMLQLFINVSFSPSSCSKFLE